MLIDFLHQLLYATIFFFGIVGIGYSILKIVGYQGRNIVLDFALAFFVSLCVYTAYISAVAFLFTDARIGLFWATILYGALSSSAIFRYGLRNFSVIKEYCLRKKLSIAMFLFVNLGATSLFFLQIYKTAVLDEWLHRPIVQSFVNTGVFPLVNPLDPTLDYIHTYHYGTQLVTAAIQITSQLDVPTALDIFKLGCFLATYSLFFGLITFWAGGRRSFLIPLCALLVTFVGSSFFFLDSFTANHLISFDGFELQPGQRWSTNSPLSYILSGITWINVPLAIALIFLIDFTSQNGSEGGVVSWRKYTLLGIIMVGLFLISELFAAVLMLIYGAVTLYRSGGDLKKIQQTSLGLFFFGLIVVAGVYATGGIVGNTIDQVVISKFSATTDPGGSISSIVSNEKVDIKEEVADQGILSLKPFMEWGYPSEKHILSVIEAPLYYLRSFFLEACILGLFIFAFIQEKLWYKEMPAVTALAGIGLVVPFLFSTSFGDLNLAKLLIPSLVLLHLFAFYWLIGNRLELGRWIPYFFIGLFLLGSIPGILMGPNIQWQLISGKGRGQYCSQNPICYKGEFTDLLRRFEREQPGLKHIQTDQKNAAKIVDLTNSYVYRQAIPGVVEYIIETPELRKINPDQIKGDMLYESGEYRIWRIH